MTRPSLGRNGEETVAERSPDAAPAKAERAAVAAPKPDPEAPPKQVVFRSKDKKLALYAKASYTDKSHGIATHVPSAGVQFDDYYLRIDDTGANATVIKWVRNHPSFGIAFIEVTDLVNAVSLPSIDELEKMSDQDLLALATSRKVEIKDGMSKAGMILELIKGTKTETK